MRVLIEKEVKNKFVSFLIYCIVAIAFVWMYISLFPSIKEQSAQLSELMDSLPKPLLDAFGIDKDSYSTVEKYLAVELMTIFWPILASVLAISRAGSAFAGSIEDRTIGIDLCLPVSRTKIFLSKLIGNWIPILGFSFISIFSILPICAAYGIDVDVTKILLLFAMSLLYVTCVYSLSTLVSVFSSEKGKVFFLVGGFLIVSYAANILASLSSTFSWLKHFSIFNYFNPMEILGGGADLADDVTLFLVVSIISMAIGLIRFRNRDISV